MTGLIHRNAENLTDYIGTVSGNGVHISGLINNGEFSYNQSAETGGGIIGDFFGGIMNGADRASSFVGSKVFSMFSGFRVSNQFRLVGNTINVYVASNATPFNINLIVFEKQFGNGDYKDIMHQLAMLTQPDGDGDLFDVMLPAYYDLEKALDAFAEGSDPLKSQLLSLSVGEWLFVEGCLVSMDVQHNWSHQVDENGQPLWLEVSIQLRTYKAMGVNEVEKWKK